MHKDNTIYEKLLINIVIKQVNIDFYYYAKKKYFRYNKKKMVIGNC